jgi:hypothetical protein
MGMTEPTGTQEFGCTVVERPHRWFSGSSSAANSKLAEFRRNHAGEPRRAVVVTEVRAFDMHGARARAEERVQALLDQYSARHRVVGFGMGPTVLALRRSDGRTEHLVRRKSAADKAYPRASRPIPQLSESFRYASIARNELTPVVQILHRWIALETLALGAHTAPQGQRGRSVETSEFVIDRVANVVALHMTRQSITATWDVVRSAGRKSTNGDVWMSVERWLHVNPIGARLTRLDRWIELLVARPGTRPNELDETAPGHAAAAFVEALLPSFYPFAEQAFLRWRGRLQHADGFCSWLEGNREQTSTALTRMYAMRNASVHTALTQTEGAEQLAIAARNIVDSVLELLPLWIEDASTPAWESLHELSQRYTRLVTENRGDGRAVLRDVDRLTLPG